MKKIISYIIFSIFIIASLFGCQKQNNPNLSIESSNVKLSCSFSIECKTALNSSELNENLRSHLPSDGIILKEQQIDFSSGDSPADILKKICEENNILLETSVTPVVGTVYVEGIAGLYEFDCGSLSGWMYFVNGESKNVSSSEYELQNGDKIEFRYTCDLGNDLD